MTVERHEARGVVWKYLSDDDHGRDERTCADCERRFIATQWYNDGDGDDHCPACHPVESMAHSLERVLAETPERPRFVDVGELMDGGQVR